MDYLYNKNTMIIQIKVPEDNPQVNDKIRRCATMLMENGSTVEVTWAFGITQIYEPIKTRRDHQRLLLLKTAP
jgi:hypothetical protein